MKYEKKLLGVCAWLAEKFNLDVGGIRLLFIFLTVFIGGGIIAYLLIYFLLMPKK